MDFIHKCTLYLRTTALLRQVDTKSLADSLFKDTPDVDPIQESITLIKAYGAQFQREKIMPSLIQMEEFRGGMLPTEIYNAAISAYTYRLSKGEQDTYLTESSNSDSIDYFSKPDIESIVEVSTRMRLLVINCEFL